MDIETIEALMKARKHLRIAHHMPGRIRMKFNGAIIHHPRSKEILNKIQSEEILYTKIISEIEKQLNL
jgi:hypothetical protein